MLIVSFDIATEKMFLVVEKDNQIIAIKHDYSTPQRYNSASLLPFIIEIFKENHIKPSQIDALAINLGPGSFTGIRAAAVIARTIAQNLNIPVIGIPSLEIYANACKTQKEKYVILDAKRSKWYTGYYKPDNSVIDNPEIKTNADVLAFIKTINAKIITEKALEESLNDFNTVFIDELDEDFGLILNQLAKQRIEKSQDYKKEFVWYNLKPVYLQTPSITMPKKKINLT